MKIARVEALHCDGGWRPWTFVRIETDSGLVGWGECSDNRSPYGIAGCVRDLADLLVGQDPRPIERLYWDMLRRVRQNSGGVSHKAMAGIELALWDIKAKALGVPVYELFGGPLRDRVRLYWSHCGTTRARMGTFLGTPPLRTYDDIAALGREVVARGFTALKTNMVIPGEPATVYFPGFASGINTTDGAPTVEILDAIDRLIGTLRGAVGPKHRQAPRALRHAVGRVRQLGPGRAPADQAVDLHTPGLVREPGDLAPVPAVPRAPRGGRGDHRRAVERLLAGRADRTAGGGVRDQHRAAQLLQPPGRPPFAPSLRRAAQRADHGDRHRRRAVEGAAGHEAAADPRRPNLAQRRAGLGSGHR